jgi:hypothetical protein
MAKGSHKVHDSDDSDSDDDDSPSYYDLVDIVKKYTTIIRRTNKQVDELELEKKNAIARSDKYENRCSELKLRMNTLVPSMMLSMSNSRNSLPPIATLSKILTLYQMN